MKYLWVELNNYIGIYNGLGLNQIRIDFTRCMYNKIIIKGKNGSGKSTIMNAINPLPDSNENFIPNLEASKIMCLLCNGIEYIIKYIHPISSSGRGTTKGYIAKSINGQFVELNPNGNISSCKDILYDEFMLDTSYLSLSKLSSENRGLVDARPADRKRHINGIMSTLETYNEIHKTLSKKCSSYAQIVKSISSKINRLGDESLITGTLNNILARMARLEAEKDKLIQDSANIKAKINQHEEVLRANNFETIMSEVKSLNTDITYLQGVVDRQLGALNIDDQTKIPEFLEHMRNSKSRLEIEVSTMNDAKRDRVYTREKLAQSLCDKQEKLRSLQSEFNYTDLKKAMEEARRIVAEYTSIFEGIGITDANLITKDEFIAAMDAINYIINTAGDIIVNYPIEYIKAVINDKLTEKDIRDKISIEAKWQESNFSDKREIEKEIVICKEKLESTRILASRPRKCKIDDCVFIKNALEASKEYSNEKLDALLKDLEDINRGIEFSNETIVKYNTYLQIYISLAAIQREINSKASIIMKLPVTRETLDSFVLRIADENSSFDDFLALYKYADYANTLEYYRNAKNQLKVYESEYKTYELKNDLIDSFIADIKELDTRITEDNTFIQDTSNGILEKEKKIEELSGLIEKMSTLYSRIINDLTPKITKRDELLNTITVLNADVAAVKELKNNLSILEKQLIEINKELGKISVERDSLNHNIMLLADYKAELADYNNKYAKLDKIRYYSSPSTGIQTLFMQMYMNNILTIANDLLSLLFDGEFQLQPFIINEGEFRIPCVGSGLLHDDISSMSTAQKSMISMILSFALLYQSSTKYNIIFLDEIDGGLDIGNRIYMITLLDRLMQILQCEQCFMISHNSELDTSMADLIILKTDPGEIYNGNIIWQY